MTSARTVVVTGVSSYWGSRVAARLLTRKGYHVIGLDPARPSLEIEGLDFVQADIRNPLLPTLLRGEQVEQVCHLDFLHSIRLSDSAFDRNVGGTEKLLEACLEAGVRKVVLKSSTAVYGARPSNPAFLTEDHTLRGSRRCGYTRDLVETENVLRNFRRRASHMVLTALRFASIVGPTAITPMTTFLGGSRTMTLLGFDPTMQLIHEQDVVEALVHALLSDRPGVFNVAARDPLPLNRVRALAGKFPLPVYHRWAHRGLRLLRRRESLLIRYLPIEPDGLRYRCVADLTRMEAEFGFRPRRTAEDALREFAQRRDDRGWHRESPALAQDEVWLRDTIARRHRADGRQAVSDTAEEGGGDDE